MPTLEPLICRCLLHRNLSAAQKRALLFGLAQYRACPSHKQWWVELIVLNSVYL